jgi:hypothetical protein
VEAVDMTTKISFRGRPSYRNTYFTDLKVTEGFRIVGADAIYMKIEAGRGKSDPCRMLEVATGKYWPATTSAVERVDLDIQVHAAKPAIY